MFPIIMATEMETFFEILIYGEASWLFILIFLGIGFLIAWKIKWFSIVCVVACIFQMIRYSQKLPVNAHYIYSILLLGVGACLFMLNLAGVLGDR